MDASRIGVNVHLAAPPLLDLMRAAGFGWIRMDLRWDLVQPHGPDDWQWHQMDQVIHSALGRGFQVFPTLSSIPRWANDGQGSQKPGPAHHWIRFVEAVAQRYLGLLHYYGIDNEPNRFISATMYRRQLLAPAAQIIRQFDPQAKICGPELSTEGDWRGWLRELMEQTGPQFLDVVTVHSYQKTGREVLKHVVGPQSLKMWLTWQQPVREILRQVGLGNKPLWLTEVGWNTAEVSEAEQASYYDQLLEGMQAEVPIDVLMCYQHVDEPHPTWWGILHEDLTPKPAYAVIQRYLRTGVV